MFSFGLRPKVLWASASWLDYSRVKQWEAGIAGCTPWASAHGWPDGFGGRWTWSTPMVPYGSHVGVVLAVKWLMAQLAFL
jgi:hypothetical protein